MREYSVTKFLNIITISIHKDFIAYLITKAEREKNSALRNIAYLQKCETSHSEPVVLIGKEGMIFCHKHKWVLCRTVIDTKTCFFEIVTFIFY